MKILVTGSAGFIGSALSISLLNRGDHVIGIDNHNEYYIPSLKEDRLKRNMYYKNYIHERVDLKDNIKIKEIFERYKPQRVVNLAGQAGVRYSLENSNAFIDSNIVGFNNILENCCKFKVKHLKNLRKLSVQL